MMNQIWGDNMHKILLAICLTFSIFSQANDKADQADAAYSQRDFNESGIKSVQTAVQLYTEAIAEEADINLKLQYKSSLANAYYFLGTSLDKKDDRIVVLESGMTTSDEVMIHFGVEAQKAHQLSQNQINDLLNTLDEGSELLLAEAMYNKGTSLAQWGNLKGISSSISRLPEVLGLMDKIELLGYQSIHEYGPYRTIGRINFKLPALFGGDLAKSEDYLIRATRNTLAEGQRYSINGYNNVFLAETLYKSGKETQAKSILETFIKADFSTLKAGSEPENKEALRTAQELLSDWQ
jgi:hypothetical protein